MLFIFLLLLWYAMIFNLWILHIKLHVRKTFIAGNIERNVLCKIKYATMKEKM